MMYLAMSLQYYSLASLKCTKNYLLLRSNHGGEFYPDKMCRKTASMEKHDPPLLFNLEHDPGERAELKPHEYGHILEKINKVDCY